VAIAFDQKFGPAYRTEIGIKTITFRGNNEAISDVVPPPISSNHEAAGFFSLEAAPMAAA